VGSSGFEANLVNDLIWSIWIPVLCFPCFEAVRFDLISSLCILLNLGAKDR
jgi:hypothetical protein